MLEDFEEDDDYISEAEDEKENKEEALDGDEELL